MSGIFFPFHFNSHHICICICTFYNHICISRFCACLFKLFDACSPPVDPHRRVVPNLSCLIIITARKCIQTSCKHANLFFSFWSIYQLVTTTNNIFPSYNLRGGCQLGCPSKHKMSQIEFLMGDMLCLYVGDPRKIFQSFMSIFDRVRSTFVLWAV